MPGRNKKKNKNMKGKHDNGKKELDDRGHTKEAYDCGPGHAEPLSGNVSSEDISSQKTPGGTTNDQGDPRYGNPQYPARENQTKESSDTGPYTTADYKTSQSTWLIDTAEGRRTTTLSSDSSGTHFASSQHNYDYVRQNGKDKDDLTDDSRGRVPDIERGDVNFEADMEKAIRNSLQEAGNAETSNFPSENEGQRKTEDHNMKKDTDDEEIKKRLLLEKQRAWNTNEDGDSSEEDNTYYKPYYYKNDPSYIEAIEKYVYFWRNEDIYSQWYKSKFSINDKEFNCAEQYMMYQKAKLFEDHKIAKEILKQNNPRKIKALGREVRNFSEGVWAANCLYIVKQANKEKFSQKDALKEQLFDTHPRILVEASPFDKIWGIGLAEDDVGAWDESTWRGKNLLGFILTEVRDELMAEEGLLLEKDKKMYLESLQKGQTDKVSKESNQQYRYVGPDFKSDTHDKPDLQRGQTDTSTFEEISCRRNQGNDQQYDYRAHESYLDKTEKPILQTKDTDDLKEVASGGSKKNNEQQKYEELEFETDKTTKTGTQTKERDYQNGVIDDCKNNVSVSDNDLSEPFQSHKTDTPMHNELEKGILKTDGNTPHDLEVVKPQNFPYEISGRNQSSDRGDKGEIQNEASDNTVLQNTDNATDDCGPVDIKGIDILVKSCSDTRDDGPAGREDHQVETKLIDKPSEVVETGVAQDDTDTDAATDMPRFKNDCDTQWWTKRD